VRFATGLALLLGLVGGIAGERVGQRLAAERRAFLSITASQVTSKDTRTAVEIRRDMDRGKW
jgi:hypothetical protein